MWNCQKKIDFELWVGTNVVNFLIKSYHILCVWVCKINKITNYCIKLRLKAPSLQLWVGVHNYDGDFSLYCVALFDCTSGAGLIHSESSNEFNKAFCDLMELLLWRVQHTGLITVLRKWCMCSKPSVSQHYLPRLIWIEIVWFYCHFNFFCCLIHKHAL